MVVNLHTGASGSATDTKFLYDAEHGGMLGLYEVFVFTRRPLWFMIFGGVFDRHPDLKVVVTENGVQWLPSLIRDMESFFDTHGGAPVRSYLEMRPRDYFEQHVWMGGSLMKRYEAEMRHEIGIDKLMWGADYPHLEGAAPVHRETLRYIFGGHARGRPAPHPRRATPSTCGASTATCCRRWPTGSGPTVDDLAAPLALDDIEDTFSWSLARPVPLAGRSGFVAASAATRSRHALHPPLSSCARQRALPGERSRRRTVASVPEFATKFLRFRRHRFRVTTPCLHEPMELDSFAESLDALVAIGRGQLRRLRLHRGAAPALAPLRGLRHRGHGGLRDGRGVGGRRGQDGGGVDRHALSGPPQCRQAPGAPRADAAPPARRAPRPGATGRSGSTRPQAIAAARRHRTEASMARDEAMLVAQAAQMGFEDFYRALSYWKQLADPDGADADDEERKAARNVYLEASVDGMWLGQMTLDPISGSIVSAELNRLEHDALRGRLRRGQGAPGSDGAPRRAGPHLGPAPGRRPRRDGDAQPHRPGRRHPPRPALHRLRRLRDPARADLRARERHRARPVGPHALDGLGLLRARHLLAGHPRRRQRAGPALHRWDPAGPRAARPDVHPPLLLRAGGELPGRPHRALRRGRAHHPGERPAALRLPQPPAHPAGATRATTAWPGDGGQRRVVGPAERHARQACRSNSCGPLSARQRRGAGNPDPPASSWSRSP